MKTRNRFCLPFLLALSVALTVGAAGCSVFSKNRAHDPLADLYDEEWETAPEFRGQAPGMATYSPPPPTFAAQDPYAGLFDTNSVVQPGPVAEPVATPFPFSGSSQPVAPAADSFAPYAPPPMTAPAPTAPAPFAASNPAPAASTPIASAWPASEPIAAPHWNPGAMPAAAPPAMAPPSTPPPATWEPAPTAVPAAAQVNDPFLNALNDPGAGNPGFTPPPLDPAAYAPSDSDPFMPAPVRRQGAWDAPLPHSSAAAPMTGSAAPPTDPWGFGPSEASIRNAVSIEEAAKREEAAAAERARRMEIATKSQSTDPKKAHLQPLGDWRGDFSSRTKKRDIEQEIILQVGNIEPTNYVPEEGYMNLPVYDWEKEQAKGFDWSVLDPVVFFTRMRDMVGLGPDEKKATAAMQKGRQILLTVPDMKNEKKLLEAAGAFDDAAYRWPDSVLEEDALHLAAECYFFAGKYPKAMAKYQALVIKYQHSKHVDNAVRRLFVMGRYWEREDFRGVSFYNYRWEKTRPTFGTFASAKKAFETIFMNDPNGPVADDAVMALASAYYDRGRYQGDPNFDQAAYYFNYLRENYPLSKHIAKAHEYELYARASSYLGAENSDKSLAEADKLAKVTLRQELEGNSREEILALQDNLVDRQAEREWTMGRFYDRKQYFGTAKIYYEKLVTKYPQSEYAEKAAKRLEQIRDKPDQPEQFGFIKKFFQARGSY